MRKYLNDSLRVGKDGAVKRKESMRTQKKEEQG